MPQNHKILIEERMISKYGYLDADAIQKYLVAIDSWLKDRICDLETIPDWLIEKAKSFKNGYAEAVFTSKVKIPFSVFIDALCQEYDIEPIWILSLIQKEQSALFRSSAPQKFIQDKIVGYGNTENKSVPDKYVGFETELFAAIRQWRKYDGFLEVSKYETANIRLYDSGDMLKSYNYERYIVASNQAEAKAFLYNPRIEGIANHANIWLLVFNKCADMKIVKEKKI